MIKRTITYAATKGLFLLSALTSLKFGCAHCNSSSKLDSCSLARTFIFLLSAFCFLISSCQQEDDFAPQGQEIRLATRATAIDGNNDGFTEGQIMTVCIGSRTNGVWKSDFFKYIYQGGEWVSDNPMKVRDFEVLEKVYAYIGFSDINEKDLYVCLNYGQFITDEDNLICDQSDDLLRYDWMIPTGEVALPTPDNPVINAHFIHGLAKVTVGNITFGSEYDETPEITDVRFKSFDSSRYNDPDDNINDEFIGWNINYGIIDVIPFEDNTDGTYTAMLTTNRELNNDDEIIIPTEWTLLTLKVNGEEKTVKLVDNPETIDVNEALLKAGKHYTFDLKVGKDKVSVEQVSMDDFDSPFGDGWNNEEDLD